MVPSPPPPFPAILIVFRHWGALAPWPPFSFATAECRHNSKPKIWAATCEIFRSLLRLRTERAGQQQFYYYYFIFFKTNITERHTTAVLPLVRRHRQHETGRRCGQSRPVGPTCHWTRILRSLSSSEHVAAAIVTLNVTLTYNH